MKPSFEISKDVERLVDYLKVNDSATYNDLRQLVGRDVQRRERYVLVSTQRILENRHGRLFVAERGVGLKLATNGQRATLSSSHPIDKIRRVTHRAQKRQHGVNLQDLSAEERLAFDIGRSVLAAIRNDTSRSLRSQLAKEILRQDGGPVSVTSILSLPRHRKQA